MEYNFIIVTITVYLIQFCTGGTTSPISPPPGCRLLSVSQGDLFLFLRQGYINPCQKLNYSTHYLTFSSCYCNADINAGRMSRASVSSSGRSGNLKVLSSNLNLTVFKTCSSQTNDFKTDTCRFQAWCLALLG